jgi:DNA polymerase III epsilon subunit-like protein
MNIIVFDTETTGTPKNYKAPVSDLQNWPRVIQLAWEIASVETEEVLKERRDLIKPDGWTIPVEEFWIKHGYSTEKNEAEGLPLLQIAQEFIDDIKTFDVQVVVAHNIEFDIKVLGAEMLRLGVRADRKLMQRVNIKNQLNDKNF